MGEQTGPSTTTRKRNNPPVIVIAAGPAGRRWRRHLAAEGLTCRAVGDVAEAVELLADGPAAVVVVERPALEVGGPALMAAVRNSVRLPVILPVEAGGRRPSPADCRRVIAAMRLARPAKRPTTALRIGKLTIDLARKRVRLRGRWVSLPPTQYRLITVLAQHRGQVVGYRELLKEVWGYNGDENEARELLKVHVRLVRRKLGLNPQTGEYLRAVRGFGYMLVDPDKEMVSGS
jgi:two-component system KDP operon response regulator KdpE